MAPRAEPFAGLLQSANADEPPYIVRSRNEARIDIDFAENGAMIAIFHNKKVSDVLWVFHADLLISLRGGSNDSTEYKRKQAK